MLTISTLLCLILIIDLNSPLYIRSMLQDDRAAATGINNNEFLWKFSGPFFRDDDPDRERATVTCPVYL